MMSDTAFRWSWANILSAKRYAVLKERYGDLDKAMADMSLEFLSALGVREEAALGALNRLEEFDAASYGKQLEKRGVTMLSVEDDAYPKVLRHVPDFPVFLYAKGDLGILREPLIAIVGTRNMSDYGRRIVSHLVPTFVGAGVVTVSGLAFGVDAEVARETLRAKGRTVAVLGHGFGTIYPKANVRLAEEIIASGGLLLSEFPLDQSPDKYTFPARNRIIAGLSLGTVVVEATADSGSLITADLALDYGRDVFAVCGPIFDANFVGCHQIISRGTAKLVTRPEEVLTELGIVGQTPGEAPRTFHCDSSEEEAVLAALSTLPAPLDDIVVKTKLSAATANATLTVLELKGAAKNIGQGKWVRG